MQRTFKKRYFPCELVRYCFKKWIHLNWPENQFNQNFKSNARGYYNIYKNAKQTKIRLMRKKLKKCKKKCEKMH